MTKARIINHHGNVEEVSDTGFFTPAPWAVENNGELEIWADGRCLLAEVCPEPDGEANAHLIAAAPYLYTQLEIAAAIFRGYADIHKAKGTAEGGSKAAHNTEYAREAERILAEARGEHD